MKRLLTLMLIMGAGSAMAHPGHLPDGTIHPAWHIENILLLLGIGFVVSLIAWVKKKT